MMVNLRPALPLVAGTGEFLARSVFNMDYNGNVRKRPDLWSYISFSRPSSRSGSSSSSLPHPNGASDPFDRPKRSRGYSVDEAYSAQAQSNRNRILKYAGIAFIILILLYFFAPGQYAKCLCLTPSRFCASTAGRLTSHRQARFWALQPWPNCLRSQSSNVQVYQVLLLK